MPLDANRCKKVYRLVPKGALVTRAWLQSHDLSGHAIDNLIKSKQLASLKNGVYKREGSSVAWGDVVYFLQRNDATDLTIGGITALQLLKLSLICRCRTNGLSSCMVRIRCQPGLIG